MKNKRHAQRHQRKGYADIGHEPLGTEVQGDKHHENNGADHYPTQQDGFPDSLLPEIIYPSLEFRLGKGGDSLFIP